MSTPATNEPIVRHWPDTTQKWMTYQVGKMTRRNEIVPEFRGRVVTGTRSTANYVTVFKLYGWGKTEQEAVQMAHKNGI